MARYYLRTPSEIKKGAPLRELPSEEELDKFLAEEELENDYVDEDVVISSLLLAARNGDEEAKEELREFLGGE